MERYDDDDPDFATREEWEAAREAAAIGGPNPDVGGADTSEPIDPAMIPVYEAGGGEGEGFELAERDLVRNASHDDGEGYPSATRSRPSVSPICRRRSTPRPTRRRRRTS